MKKRGQFYLIAALVIIAVMASLSVVYNEAKSPNNNVVIYDLSNEINFEILQLLDSGYFNAQNQTELNDSINSIIKSYSTAYSDTTMIFIYGDREKVYVVAYFTDTQGEICFGPEGNNCVPMYEKIFISGTLDPFNGVVSFRINGEEYTFNVEEYGQNFYLVLKRIEGLNGEIFVTKPPKCSTNNICPENKICVEGNCVPCGGGNQHCCPPNSCHGQSLECVEGTCIQE